MGRKVFIGMSGGVDSSVAAYLLKEQGYDVTGITMRLCGDEAISDAAACAAKLGINFEERDLRQEFCAHVIEHFVRTYEAGMTPNPCIECNKCIKFNRLSSDELIATGHYATIEFKDGRYCLKKSAISDKDQSYFLYALGQDVLSRVIFPLGGLSKDEVRSIAEMQGLVNAHKKDSQDICFIENGNYGKFIEQYRCSSYTEGNFVDTQGNVLGKHKGIINYTIGQRKGLGLALKKPMYVVKLDMERNEVVLDDNEALFQTRLTADSFNWVSIENPGKPFRALGRIRYRHKEAPCTVTPNRGGTVSVVFDEPQRAITAGQSLVLYDEKTATYVLGGGVIMSLSSQS